jgi:flagellar biosynthesis chaperone FliJ
MIQMPSVTEARQLHRLRTLRVQRAREQIPPAQAQVDQALAAVQLRQRQIAHLRHETQDLRDAIVTTLAPRLPRWSEVTTAQQELLADQLERAEYGLIDDEHALEAAQEKLQQARSELTRALAREDAVRGLAQEAKRCRVREREQRAEREVDDQIRPQGARAGA